jgi:hypothetical protein
MNDFWDNLGKAVNEAACKAIKASGDAVELTKTSLNIKFDEIKRDSFFKEIGKMVYENYKANPDSTCCENVKEFCMCIAEIDASIGESKVRAAHLVNKKFCEDCGIKLDKKANFCYSCGAKQPIIIEEEQEECCCCGKEPEACCEPETEKAEPCCDGDSCSI